MSERLNAWQLFDQIWRSTISVLWRLPLLVFGSVLFYAAFASALMRVLPFAGLNDVGLGTFDAIAYAGLRAIIYAPLMVGVIDWILHGNTHPPEFWTAAMGRFVLWTFAGEVLDICLTLAFGAIPIWRWAMQPHSTPELVLLEALLVLQAAALPLVLFFILVRLSLLWPAITMGESGGPELVVRIWRRMRGHYGFALMASALTMLPYAASGALLASLSQRHFPGGDSPYAARYWEALLARGAEHAIWFVLCASLAAWLYRAVAARAIVTGRIAGGAALSAG